MPCRTRINTMTSPVLPSVSSIATMSPGWCSDGRRLAPRPASALFGLREVQRGLDADILVAESSRPFGSCCHAQRGLHRVDHRRIELAAFQILPIDRLTDLAPEGVLECGHREEAIRYGIDVVAGELAGEWQTPDAGPPRSSWHGGPALYQVHHRDLDALATSGLLATGQRGGDQERRLQPAGQVRHLEARDGGNPVAQWHQGERRASGQIVEVVAGAPR